MSVPEKGKVLPKKGKVFPTTGYTVAIASALRQDLGNTHRAIKTVARWTGASERTVKNWLAGSNGPSGEHLVALVHHSDEVLESCLILTGRKPTIAGKKLEDARDKLVRLLKELLSVAE
jgi:hypothetical protein